MMQVNVQAWIGRALGFYQNANHYQKIVLQIVAVLVVVMALYVPKEAIVMGQTQSTGYTLLWQPSQAMRGTLAFGNFLGAREQVQFSRLFFQYFVLALAAFFALKLCADPPRSGGVETQS